MASSSCNSSTIDNVRTESIICHQCGRRVMVMVSRSANNPGRLYYSCSNHGWLKWVVAECVNCGKSRRAQNDYVDSSSQEGLNRDERSNTRNQEWNCTGLLWALVNLNLVLLAAYIFALVIQLIRG